MITVDDTYDCTTIHMLPDRDWYRLWLLWRLMDRDMLHVSAVQLRCVKGRVRGLGREMDLGEGEEV